MPATRSDTVQPREDRSFSMTKANVYVLLMTIPIGLAFFGPFWLIWRDLGGADWNLFVFALLFLAGAVVHELLHGITWMMTGGASHETVKFGFQAKTLTPYAHCTEPLGVGAYRLGAAVPGIVLGIVPAIVAIAIGHAGLLVFGFLFTLAAGGDALILWVLRDVPEGAMVEDHPERAGCYVILPERATGDAEAS